MHGGAAGGRGAIEAGGEHGGRALLPNHSRRGGGGGHLHSYGDEGRFQGGGARQVAGGQMERGRASGHGSSRYGYGGRGRHETRFGYVAKHGSRAFEDPHENLHSHSGSLRGRQKHARYQGANMEEHVDDMKRSAMSSDDGLSTREKITKEEDGGEDTVMKEATEGEDEDGDDSKSSIRCSRCTRKGHIAAKCTTEVYCVICDGHDHVNYRCPMLKQPRPVAHAVGYAVHELGFYHIPRPPLPRARKDSKSALIMVEGGQLTKEQVIVQLQRIFPGKWKWELADHEVNAFTTKFPSKSELQRAVAFGVQTLGKMVYFTV